MAEPKPAVVASRPGPSCARRQIVRGAALAACAPALGSLLGCANRISPERDVTASAPVDGRLVIPAGQFEELGRAGGAVVVHTSCVNAVLVVNTGSGILAMGAICPHAACELAWVAEDRQAECPCHGSRFAGDGTVLSGPATTSLPAYPATVDASGAIVISIFAGDNVFPPLVDNRLTFNINQHQELLSPGGAVVGRPDGSPFALVITHPPANVRNQPPPDAGGLAAMSAVCPHAACTVQPISPTALRCPCHGSQFLLDGTVTNPPAVDNLLPLPLTFDPPTGTVTVDFSQFAC
ncbi:MAG: ubiquinol-cytochrome c reductase iron-sulfur subunit [Myxococcales bacterium]